MHNTQVYSRGAMCKPNQTNLYTACVLAYPMTPSLPY
jgi:hypothetical protein